MSKEEILSGLSPTAFHDEVLSLKPKVAVFDCDGTLWSGDAGSTFMAWSMQPREGGRPALLAEQPAAWLRERYDGYKRGAVSELAICGEMVQVYADIPVATLRTAAAEFFEAHVRRNIFPAMRSLLEALQKTGCDIWAVSSTNDWVIEYGAAQFGIPANRVLAARTESLNGVAGGKLLDVPTDEGKVTALERARVTRPDAVFGNSVHDAAMLAIGRRAFPVNPTPALVERAAHSGWPCFFPTV